MFVLNSSGELTFINAAFQKITGLSSEECVGRSLGSLLSPDDFFSGISAFRQALTGELPVPTELHLLSRSGDSIPLEILFSPSASDGQGEGVVAVGRDLRDRLQFEGQWREVPKLNSLGRLVAGVSHHYNNLLTLQHGYLSLLLNEVRDQPKLLGFLKEAMAATESAVKLTRDFFFFGRRKAMVLSPLALGRTLRNLTEKLRTIAGEKVDLEIHVQNSLPIVFADRAMFEQVVIQLVANASSAMPDGGHLTLTMHAVDSALLLESAPIEISGRVVCLSVTDAGTGIPPEHLDKIFDPFFSTKSLQEGVGLGLASVHGIVQQHGGWIRVKSARRKGTTFRVYLPETQFSLRPAREPIPSANFSESLMRPGG